MKPEAAINSAWELLATAKHGLSDMRSSDGSRRLAGYRSAVVFGRAVTNALENMRSDVPDFNSWYEPRTAALGEDPRFRRLYKVRTEILHKAQVSPTASLYIEHLNFADLARLQTNPPPGATGFFMGDSSGGSGWTVDLGDGRTERYYVELPRDMRVDIRMEVADGEAVDVVSAYLDALEQFIRDAYRQFVCTA
ncbi:hypothetical protein E4V99_14045 [Microbacterium sp. dk485]|uniref:hypothetical protein n=1 Tax=Microbacterium sp. dk485 TaxID=2560021 RepID=UPI00107330D8|nr:hypothetical protein [Microbacterium sp. dk485]TFV82051.1 hypothetical protein E4V99_14045 [Microbacterium sp. dk485]